MEDHRGTLSRRARGLLALDLGPAIDLLLLDQRDLRCGSYSLCTQAGFRDPVSEDHHQRPVAQQRQDFGELVGAAVSQTEAGRFTPPSGIRFPQNGCLSCAQLDFANYAKLRQFTVYVSAIIEAGGME
jgi:hypothetical protein